MAISLKFFMIKRGLSFEKLSEMSGAKSAKELIAYINGLSVAATANDEVDVQNYFASITSTSVVDEAAPVENTDTVEEQPVKTKVRRSKKTGDADV